MEEDTKSILFLVGNTFKKKERVVSREDALALKDELEMDYYYEFDASEY